VKKKNNGRGENLTEEREVESRERSHVRSAWYYGGSRSIHWLIFIASKKKFIVHHRPLVPPVHIRISP
jgi:hypothetical protein